MAEFTDDTQGRLMRDAVKHLKQVAGEDFHEVPNPQVTIVAYESMVLFSFSEDGHISRVMGVSPEGAVQLAGDIVRAAVEANHHFLMTNTAEQAETEELIAGVADLLKQPPAETPE